MTDINVEFLKRQIHGNVAKQMLSSDQAVKFINAFCHANKTYAVVIRNTDSICLSEPAEYIYGEPMEWTFTDDLYEAVKVAAKNKKNSSIYEWDLGVNLLL